MPRGVPLTEFQKRQATAYRWKNYSRYRKDIKNCKSAIAEFLKNHYAPGKRKKNLEDPQK